MISCSFLISATMVISTLQGADPILIYSSFWSYLHDNKTKAQKFISVEVRNASFSISMKFGMGKTLAGHGISLVFGVISGLRSIHTEHLLLLCLMFATTECELYH